MNNILMISYPFPPLTKSGSFRPAKFVKYLPQYNWQPYVITVTPNSDAPVDDSLVKDLSCDLQVVRVHVPNPVPKDHFVNWVRKWGFNDPDEKSSNGRAGAQEQTSILAKSKEFLQKVIMAPLSIIQYPPIDHSLYWSLRIIPVARKIIKENDIKLVFTTSPPFSPLITGWILKKITGIPWVADFRDPWTTEELRYKSKGWRLRVNKFVEHHTLRGADSVIGVTPNWVEDLQCLAGEPEKSEKYHLITNGYDESDFTDYSLPDLDVDSGIKISHIGSLYEGSIGVLLNGLNHINHSALTKLRIELIGYMHPHDLDELNQATQLENISYQPDRISHEKSLALMRNSHVLLLSLPFEYYPGKVFEYMRVGRPVLAITNRGAGADIINQTGIGCVVNRNDSEKLIKILEQIAFDYEGFVGSYYHPNWEVIHQFERRVLTQKLSTVFNNLSIN